MVSEEKLHQRHNNLPELNVLHSDGARAQPEPTGTEEATVSTVKHWAFFVGQRVICKCSFQETRTHAAIENTHKIFRPQLEALGL